MFERPAELLFRIIPTTFAHVLASTAHVGMFLKAVSPIISCEVMWKKLCQTVSTFVESCWEMLRPCRVKRTRSTSEMREVWDWEQCVERASQTASTFREQRNVEKMLRQSLNEIKLFSTCLNTSFLLKGGVKRPQLIGSQQMLKECWDYCLKGL